MRAHGAENERVCAREGSNKRETMRGHKVRRTAKSVEPILLEAAALGDILADGVHADVLGHRVVEGGADSGGYSGWEKETRGLLGHACLWATAEAKKGRVATEAVRDRLVAGGSGRVGGAECVVQVWKEMEMVCSGVLGAVEGGRELW